MQRLSGRDGAGVCCWCLVRCCWRLCPKSAEIQCGVIWAMQNGFFNDMPVKSVQAAAASLQTHLETAKPAILAKIRLGNKIEKDGEAELKAACETWRRSFKA